MNCSGEGEVAKIKDRGIRSSIMPKERCDEGIDDGDEGNSARKQKPILSAMFNSISADLSNV